MEFAEVASMSMELLTFPYLEEFYSSDDAMRARRDHLESLSTMLPWIATIDAFQHWVLSEPHDTPSQNDREQYWRAPRMTALESAIDWTGHETLAADHVAPPTAYLRPALLLHRIRHRRNSARCRCGCRQSGTQAMRSATTRRAWHSAPVNRSLPCSRQPACISPLAQKPWAN